MRIGSIIWRPGSQGNWHRDLEVVKTREDEVEGELRVVGYFLHADLSDVCLKIMELVRDGYIREYMWSSNWCTTEIRHPLTTIEDDYAIEGEPETTTVDLEELIKMSRLWLAVKAHEYQ